MLELRAFNAGTRNAMIKASYELGRSSLPTSDSNAPAGGPGTTAYSSSVAGHVNKAPGYVEDDKFAPNENWDFNPFNSSTFADGFQDAVGKLVFVDDTSSVVAVNFLAHSAGFKGSSSVDEFAFVSGSNIACVFSGQALYPPGT
jgi:hypothetical protein